MGKAQAIWALGCMSGTSIDGVDAAMVLTDGVEVFEFGATGFRPYRADERTVIAAALGSWPGDEGVAAAAHVVVDAHAELIARFGGVELVGFHGQTLAHDPDNGRTHQVGNGPELAHLCGHPVVWDFRSNDMVQGGQGAPLAPFYHFALARRMQVGRIGFLNIGGVGNVTLVDATKPDAAADGALLAFDTGPGNALMDDFMRVRSGLACDYGGALAAGGAVDALVVKQFLHHEYFYRSAPKSLDRNGFPELAAAVEGLSDMDGLATLAECTVQAVAAGLESVQAKVARLLICGGGRKNDHLMARLAQVLPMPVENIDSAGFDGDMLEAQAFAYLAVRARAGLPLSASGTTGVAVPTGGGRINNP